ncbi:MAG TPA: sodium:solute symporter family protein [Vicinamibacteria bacterium]|nr:sodium:solute symporter family protein [Vicinamibacteria bacterium]
MHLQALDWVVIAITLAVCFAPALFFGKRSGKNTAEFFASGRSVPWWLAGLSMVATTFSSDTPNLVTDIVRRQGVAGNWQWWAFTLTGVATVFFFARLWRRSGVLTDLEFYELRYSGAAARVVRGFRAVYLGFFFNCVIMATVNMAAVKIANVLFGLHDWQTLIFVGLLNVIFAAHSGLWGVLVIDMIQFFVKMTAVIAAAYFAVKSVGGLSVMVAKVGSMSGPVSGAVQGFNYLNVLPTFAPHNSSLWDLAVAVFIMPIAVQWWAVWYPGAEPGGGSYIAQRMLASKSERDSLGGVLFFNVAHYVLRPWPWILVGLCSLIVFPSLGDIKNAFPNLDPKWLGHDIAYPAMISKVLPVGFMGLMVGGLIAANSSTILTHLNWGASYLVHDFYKRFLRPGRSERHYVTVGRLATIGLFVCAAGMMYLMTSAKDSFDLILQIGAGTGLLYILRWFWWRINAWCEVVAMASSFLISLVFLVTEKQGLHLPTHSRLIYTILFTTICWVIAAYVAPQTDEKALVDFYRKVKPFGPGWRRFQQAEGLPLAEATTGENIPLALVGWVSGCATIWSSLFAVGNFLYGRMGYAALCLAVFVVAGGVLLYVVNRLWTSPSAAEQTTPQVA